jgi:ribose 5-phosphate isomerase A
MTNIELKRTAAQKAIERVKNGMIIGLGTGSTVQFALELISEKIKSGEIKDIAGIPTSKRTEEESKRLGIPVLSINELRKKTDGNKIIDLTIDGADEADEKLNLIKGGGGAMLREKIIAHASKINVTIIDESKLSEKVGSKCSLPIEVLEFSIENEKYFLNSIGAEVTIRKNSSDKNFITDNGNLILDAKFSAIENADELNNKLNSQPGILGHGLFVGICDELICAGMNGVETFIKK